MITIIPNLLNLDGVVRFYLNNCNLYANSLCPQKCALVAFTKAKSIRTQ